MGQFDNWKPRSHYVGLLMTDAAGKSNLEKYNEADVKYREKKALFEGMTDKQKDMKMGEKALNEYEEALALKKKLEPIKNEPNVGETCLTKLEEIYIEATTGRKKVIENDYLTKGVMVEEESITLYSLFTGNFHKKNILQGENKWLTGNMDFEWEDEVIDTKSSWDIWTFNKAKRGSIPGLYEWQLHCYMWLFNKQKAKLAYCLVNTPEHLIRKEETRLMYAMFGSESNFSMAPEYMIDLYAEGCREIRLNHIFDDPAIGPVIPIEKRIKIFSIERDETRIERIKARIEWCRWYLNNYEIINSENKLTDNIAA